MTEADVEQAAFPALTRAEIDLTALAHNYSELRRVTQPSADIMAVVKADAYGHGAVRVAQTALECGARFLAVARFSEALQLRQAGIDAPILLFGFSLPEHVGYMADNGIRASVNTRDAAELLSQRARREGKTIRAHIKVDTGMGRLGLLCDELSAGPGKGAGARGVLEDILAIAALPNLEVEGIFTHFANADAGDKTHCGLQFARFASLLENLAKKGLHVAYRHAANSAAVIELPETHLDLVRPGVSQYGLWPSADVDRRRIDLRPVMSLKSTVIQVKSVGPGFAVSYGSTHVTPRPTRIATVPIGYADGFNRLLSSRGHMLVRGGRAPIIGRVCMDLTMIDVGRIPGVTLGDEVVVMGRQGNEEITADDIAALVGTINYEVVSALTARVARVYTK